MASSSEVVDNNKIDENCDGFLYWSLTRPNNHNYCHKAVFRGSCNFSQEIRPPPFDITVMDQCIAMYHVNFSIQKQYNVGEFINKKMLMMMVITDWPSVRTFVNLQDDKDLIATYYPADSL